MMVRLFIAGLLAVSVFVLSPLAFAGADGLLQRAGSESAVQSADIEVFARSGCPHCAKAELFLQALEQEQPALKIVIHDVIREPAALERLQLPASRASLALRAESRGFKANAASFCG
jgi:glutaredoxin